MLDDKSKIRPQDALPVSVHEIYDYDIESWTKKLGRTAEQLKAWVRRAAAKPRNAKGSFKRR
jgi:hypothetical protein